MSNLVDSHLPCPTCDSSDAYAEYADGGGKCFSCGWVKLPDAWIKGTNIKVKKEVEPFDDQEYEDAEVSSIPERDIAQTTVERYKVRVSDNAIMFPYYKDDALVGFKTRLRKVKKFFATGDMSSPGLFGKDAFSAKGKFVTITEGEIDAMSVYQMTGSKWPVVSLKNGAQAALKDCQAEYEWLNKFETIVLCFDNDEPGKEATKKVAELFGSKVRTMRIRGPHKDANDYLRDQASKEFIDDWWSAEQNVPDGIVAGSGLWEEMNKAAVVAPVLYPFPDLNTITYGIRYGELVTVTAGSGLGKSQFMREIVWHVLSKTQENIGLLFLEESVSQTGKSIMSLAANKPLHLPTTEVTPEEMKKAFDETLGLGRIYLFDHFGSTSIDNIVDRVRYMAKGLGCKFIFLDHVSIVVSSQAAGDERKAIDEIMTRLRMLVQECNIALIIVSHLKRPENKGHEEGAVTSLSQLRGSASIAQLSDMVIGLERNGQAEDPTERNTTYVRVLKNRFSGVTGPAGACLYSLDTGRMLPKYEEAL